MLLQLLIARPQTIGPILAATPTWVWLLLAGLLWLGARMLRNSRVGALRAGLTPVAMTGLSLWGTLSAFGQSVALGHLLLAWGACAALLALAVGSTQPPAGTRYDPRSRSFALPGSWVPLALIMGIFMVKYVVGIEVTMQPALAQDASDGTAYSALYGAFSGIFTGRALRLARLALRTNATGLAARPNRGAGDQLHP